MDDLMTLDELCTRVGMSVRNVRFYTTRGLVPAPIRRGRQGYYAPEHVVRLELVRELQAHGFTLAALEKYLARVPETATTADIALQRTMMAPWASAPAEEVSRADLDDRAGRSLSDDEIDTLIAFGVVIPGPEGGYGIVSTHFTIGLELIDLGVPLEAVRAAKDVYDTHGRAVAEELNTVFKTLVLPAYQDAGVPPEHVQGVVERLKPLSIAALVAAYERGISESRRERIARRTR